MQEVTKIAAALLGVMASCTLARSQPVQPPAQVTTDTPEYCATLRDRLDGMAAEAPPLVLTQVRSLETEGRRLCDAGQTRGGILRLRRALVLMMHPDDARDER